MLLIPSQKLHKSDKIIIIMIITKYQTIMIIIKENQIIISISEMGEL